MIHPLEWLPPQNRRKLFLGFLAGTVALLFLFQLINRPLISTAAPSGIVSLQTAWTPENAKTMLDSWGPNAVLFAAFGLGFDYLFMPVYALSLALGTLLAAGRHPGWFASLGPWVAYGAFLAAIFDSLENLGQFQQLFNGRLDLAGWIVVFSVVKFSLILASMLYGLTGWMWKVAK